MTTGVKKARLLQKHDTEANWNNATNFIPLDGEMIIYDTDNNYNYTRVKVGDGVTKIGALPFLTDTLTVAEVDEICGGELTPDVGDTLPVSQGGTGASTAAAARTNLDVYSKAEAVAKTGDTMTGTLSIQKPGQKNRFTEALTVGVTDPDTSDTVHVDFWASSDMAMIRAGINKADGTSQAYPDLTFWDDRILCSEPPAIAENTTIDCLTTAKAVATYAQKKVIYSTTDLTAGTSTLANGEVYLVYE